MPKDKLLTINVVTYNQEKYITKCLESLISQKTDFNYIIRIFDDCSTDNTGKICEDYAKKYPNKVIFLQNEKNLGDVLNAKRSYDNIETKYYMYIEGDDYCCDDNKFQLQVDILEKHPECSFCSHQTLAQNLNDKILVRKKWKYSSFLKEGIHKYSDLGTKHRICINTHMSSRIVRTECIDFSPCPRLYLFDSTQMLMLLEKGDMYYIDKIMSVYQQTGEGLYSGSNALYRVSHYTKHMLLYQQYSKDRLDLLIYKTISNYTNYVLLNLNNSTKPLFLTKFIIKHNYFIPLVVLDILCVPINLFLWLKNKINPKREIKELKNINDKIDKQENQFFEPCSNWFCLSGDSKQCKDLNICQCSWSE